LVDDALFIPYVCVIFLDKKSVGSASAGRLNNNASSSSASVVSHGPTGGGGLFPGGVPSKPSDTKRFMATNGVPNSRTNSAAPQQQQQPSTNGRKLFSFKFCLLTYFQVGYHDNFPASMALKQRCRNRPHLRLRPFINQQTIRVAASAG
jgi:hypothetical protein